MGMKLKKEIIIISVSILFVLMIFSSIGFQTKPPTCSGIVDCSSLKPDKAELEINGQSVPDGGTLIYSIGNDYKISFNITNTKDGNSYIIYSNSLFFKGKRCFSTNEDNSDCDKTACTIDNSKIVCNNIGVNNVDKLKLYVYHDYGSYCCPDKSFTIITQPKGLSSSDEFVTIGSQRFENNGIACYDDSNNDKIYFHTISGKNVYVDISIYDDNNNKKVIGPDNPQNDGTVEIDKSKLSVGENRLLIVTTQGYTQVNFQFTIYKTSSEGDNKISVVFPKDGSTISEDSNFLVCGNSKTFDVNVNVSDSDYKKVGSIKSSSVYIPASGNINFEGYTGKRKIKINTTDTTNGEKKKIINLNINGAKSGNCKSCSNGDCVSEKPDTNSESCGAIPKINLKICKNGDLTFDHSNPWQQADYYKFNCKDWDQAPFGTLHFITGCKSRYVSRCDNGICQTYMHYNGNQGGVLMVDVDTELFNIYYRSPNNNYEDSLCGDDQCCEDCDFNVSPSNDRLAIDGDVKLSYDSYAGTVFGIIRELTKDPSSWYIDNGYYTAGNWLAGDCSNVLEPYEGKVSSYVAVGWLKLPHAHAPKNKEMNGLLISWKKDGDTFKPYVKKCLEPEYCGGYKVIYLNYKVDGGVYIYGGLWGDGPVDVGIMVVYNIYEDAPISSYKNKKNGETNCDFECKQEEPATPEIYLTNAGYGIESGDKKVQDSMEALQYRDLMFNLHFNGIEQPKNKEVVWVLNVTDSNGNHVGTYSTFSAPVWSGNMRFPIKLRFNEPGIYHVKSKIYYASSGKFNYNVPIISYSSDGTRSESSGETHTTEVCKTTQPIWYWLKNIDSKKFLEYDYPWGYTLTNFITQTKKIYGFAQYPICEKIQAPNYYNIIKIFKESDDVGFDIKNMTTDPPEFTVNVKPSPVWVDISINGNNDKLTIKNGEIVNAKLVVHNLTSDRLKGLFVYLVEQVPRKVVLSENNPKFYDGRGIPEGPMKTGIPIQSCDLSTLKCDISYVHVRKCNPDEVSPNENPNNCYVFTTRYGPYVSPGKGEPLSSICKNNDGSYDQSCISGCSESGNDMHYCPHTIWGYINYFGFDSDLVKKDWFSTMSTNPNYIQIFISPEDFTPTPCNAHIGSAQLSNDKINFGENENVSLELSGNENCYYYVTCKYQNNTLNNIYTKTPYETGQFDATGVANVNLSAAMDKSGLWKVTSCTLYSSEQGSYKSSNVKADEEGDIGKFEVGLPELTDGDIIGNSEVNVGKESQYIGHAYYDKDGLKYLLKDENVYYNWSLKDENNNCDKATIIGQKEGYNLNKIKIKGLIKGSCTLELNLTFNGKSIKIDKSISINPSNIGYLGNKKEILLTPSRVQITKDYTGKITILAKISGYQLKDAKNKLITFTASNVKFVDDVKSCLTDNYGRCKIYIKNNNQNTNDISISANTVIGSDNINGQTKISVIDETNPPEDISIPLLYGWNIIGTIGTPDIGKCDYDTYTYDENGKYVKVNDMEKGKIYWIYIKDNLCTLKFSGDLSNVERDINNKYKYVSYSQLKSIDNIDGITAAFEWNDADNKWENVQFLFPGKAYLVKISQS